MEADLARRALVPGHARPRRLQWQCTVGNFCQLTISKQNYEVQLFSNWTKKTTRKTEGKQKEILTRMDRIYILGVDVWINSFVLWYWVLWPSDWCQCSSGSLSDLPHVPEPEPVSVSIPLQFTQYRSWPNGVMQHLHHSVLLDFNVITWKLGVWQLDLSAK